ncbi:hypothetical protein KAF25_010522 [Fusarium avenaceum]|uniref:RING-type domain-containing protein n=1 Tax=Fusarium avenaceum TaxID=40199 RepID=A0A9P7GXH5_9HYPO|nr:hypothetical protein KAF25_010522 [Fusarium avenaceum]
MEEPDDCKETSLPPQDACFEEVSAVFPDICLNYLQPIAKELDFIAQDVINHILDLEDSGQTYTKRPKQTSKKRKREADDQNDEQKNKVLEAKRRYIDPHRPALHKNSPQANVMKQMIAGDFPLVPMRTIQQLLAENNYHLFPTFTAVDNATARVDRASLSWKYKKTPSVQPGKYKAENIDASIESSSIDWEKELMKELQAARLVRSDAAEKDRVKTLAKETERRNFEAAEARGELVECGCCFADVAPNRLVYCNGDVTHSFCLDCCRRNAETQIGLEKYGLECLSTDGCEAGFSYSERKKFLDKNLTSALDRIEQTANIREAMLPNLAQCPFCQYAEEYPPANINKEFRCRNADCMITSCRLCNFKTHIPKTCDEATLDRGVDVRREVEEAMSEALIRNCNKHFNDESRGGTKGNCPLFDSVEERHENDIKEAEKAARKKVLEENPDLAPDFLDFRISKKVKKDDNRRKHREQRIRDRGLFGAIPAPPAAPFPGNYQDVQWMPQPQQMQQLPPEQQQILAMNPLDWAAFHAGMHYQYRPFQPFDNQNNRQQ